MDDQRDPADLPDAQDETLLQQEYVYRGRLLNLRVDTVRTTTGHESRREIVEHPGAVAVVPLLPDGRAILVRQYRRPTGEVLLEIPAGTREPGEDAATCAAREIEEEIGYRVGTLAHLATFFTSPGFCTERMDLFVATDLTPLSNGPAAEFADALEYVNPSQVPALVRSGAPLDAKSIAGLLLVAADELREEDPSSAVPS